MSGDAVSFLKLSEVDVTSSLQPGDYVVVIKENTNDGVFECKRITIDNLGGEFTGGGGGNPIARFTITLPGLTAGQQRGTITLGASAILFKIESTEPARIRLYGTLADADADLTRPVGTPSDPNSGLMVEFNATGGDLVRRYMPALVVYNDDDTLNNFLYYTIDCTAITDVFFKYAQLESVGGF